MNPKRSIEHSLLRVFASGLAQDAFFLLTVSMIVHHFNCRRRFTRLESSSLCPICLVHRVVYVPLHLSIESWVTWKLTTRRGYRRPPHQPPRKPGLYRKRGEHPPPIIEPLSGSQEAAYLHRFPDSSIWLGLCHAIAAFANLGRYTHLRCAAHAKPSIWV